ncbi:hypothetical protein A7C99_1207 [Trichophyton rubrum]|uniref:DASH complex subunit ASK1 n=4 Tax=Trichophyton TaxID=5550 RepID=A0A178F6W9_TRIRU|nr:hypothetical protein A7C99_1207 [Trichophyton rubrum]
MAPFITIELTPPSESHKSMSPSDFITSDHAIGGLKRKLQIDQLDGKRIRLLSSVEEDEKSTECTRQSIPVVVPLSPVLKTISNKMEYIIARNSSAHESCGEFAMILKNPSMEAYYLEWSGLFTFTYEETVESVFESRSNEQNNQPARRSLSGSMSHPPAVQRSLTLTEELEKLEQSITLTLQEIDSNFNKAHRIVTSSIIPIVEQYAENSKDVWETSKFWKQFFEASANVSLSGYEEQPPIDNEQDATVSTNATATDDSTYQEESESYASPSSEHISINQKVKDEDDPDLSTLSLSPSHSTPRARGISSRAIPDDDTTSPRMEYSSTFDQREDNLPAIESPLQLCGAGPRTPGKENQLGYNEIATPNTSSSTAFNPTSKLNLSTALKGDRADPLMHRVLDKTYRVQATPLTNTRRLTTAKGNNKFNVATPSTSRYKLDDSPLSSPELEAPKLHTELFDSPMIRRSAAKRNHSETRTPGVSILATPSNKFKGDPNQWDSDEDFKKGRYADDDDEDDSALVDFSPPKTMQFHVPQSRLMKTPAKEASKRIVSDLLYTAGASELTDDLGDIYDDPNNSPSIIRRSGVDETF